MAIPTPPVHRTTHHEHHQAADAGDLPRHAPHRQVVFEEDLKTKNDCPGRSICSPSVAAVATESCAQPADCPGMLQYCDVEDGLCKFGRRKEGGDYSA